ncbi:hypothetical protein [Helicobacter aurati]|uniref:hypothetical protein n=1 Tax=Helicobacter aurati TaxID=137778 RepID=UPI001F29B5D3|nr:hypothetical protein [Helicobacter aurati]
MFNTGNKTYTTDTLADIKKTQEILRSGKNPANLEPKDRAKVEHIWANYSDEVESMDFSNPDSDLGKLATKNHFTTDTVTLNKNGEVVQTAQQKVVKKTEDLLKDRYLEGDSAVDKFKVPSSDYKKHKEELEKMIAKGKDSDDPKVREKARKAEIALEKLNANNVYNRLMCENPRIAAVATQAIVAGGHVLQASASGAIVAAISTFASGVVWEVKDMCANRGIDSETSIMDRIKRLLRKVIDSFKGVFARGAGFGIIDTAMGIVGQIFKSFAAKLKTLWHNIRASAKSIYNGICDYVSGKITSIRELLSMILKSLFSAAWVIPVIALEQKLELMLPFGTILAPLFSIAVGAFVVVLTHRSIDMALDVLFTMFAQRDRAKMRAEEITTLVVEKLPALINERKELTALIESVHKQRLLSLESSFADYRQASINCDDEGIYQALNRINKLWGAELSVKTIDDVKAILQKPNRTGKLQW